MRYISPYIIIIIITFQVSVKNFTGNSGKICTHDLVQTSSPLDHRACPMMIGWLEYSIAAGFAFKTSALVSRRSWVRILPESPVKFFTDTWKALSCSALHTLVQGKNLINCLSPVERISSTYKNTLTYLRLRLPGYHWGVPYVTTTP